MINKNFKQHIPAIISGVCCWVLISAIAGTACVFRATFGLPCPACGSSRAAAALLQGNIAQSLEFHPLIFVSLALIAALIFKPSIFKSKRANILLICLFSLYIAVFIIRIVLYFPESEPMTFLDASLLGRFINFICNIYNTR